MVFIKIVKLFYNLELMILRSIIFVTRQLKKISLYNVCEKHLVIKRFKTIYALSSGTLPSAIAVVRISGIK